ncbi:MAG: alpha-glucosidase [Nocardioides sp.]
MSEASDWFKSAVVYQIYPRSFQDSNGDGIGDIPGITSRLDHLATLGIDVIWLSPVYRSPMDDNGYDISDYQDIDPLFGTLEDFDELLAHAHARGIKIVMDLVVNHSSDEHAWFEESRGSRDNAKAEWYVWRDPRPGLVGGTPGAEPTNWGSFFSGPAWTWDESRGQYYLHLFSPKQPDLNWENDEVREAVFEMMRWWLDRGVDGFRMDVINLIHKRSYEDGPLFNGWGFSFDQIVDGPKVHEWLQEMHREVFAGRDGLLTVGEMPGVSIEQALEYTDPANAEVDMVFQFDHVGLDSGPGGKFDVQPIDLVRLKEVFGRWQEGMADRGWNSLYWDNHDQPRAVSRFGNDSPEHRVASAKALATVLHLHRGTPYVYQGEELGMTNSVFDTIADFRDLESLNHFAEATIAGADPEAVLRGLRKVGRDNARTPVQWDASAHAGFTTGEPWIAVNPNSTRINAAAQVGDPDSVFAHHQALIRLRHDDPVVAHGDFTMLLPDHPQLYAYTRSYDGRTLLVIANLSDSEATAEIEAYDWTSAPIVPASGRGSQPREGRTLQPWEALIVDVTEDQ